MDKKSKTLLQKIDCNYNDCKFMERDFEALQAHQESYKGLGITDKLAFGYCMKFRNPVSFIPETCQLKTQSCFVHRKTIDTETLTVTL